ncbi:gamma-glutamylcyclotransferase (plasmid) [Pseudomonas luteola]|uniref:gamma-glutamylcyclotransferase n=1 Tax=Pseudomonas luteola TaxID=47886 RepID=UPI003DA1BB4C
MLTRDTLRNGAFLTAFRDTPEIDWWSEERINALMQEMLACRPAGESVWLFAYGSLIWNLLVHFAEKCPALLEGWRRSFCIRLVIARGSAQRPGRMMALVPGGHTAGLALRLHGPDLEQELAMVWTREMIGGVYRPEWTQITLADKRTVPAIIFTANQNSRLYESDDTIETIAPVIAGACGPLGSNQDYVMQLDSALQRHGIEDRYIHTLASRLRPES